MRGIKYISKSSVVFLGLAISLAGISALATSPAVQPMNNAMLGANQPPLGSTYIEEVGEVDLDRLQRDIHFDAYGNPEEEAPDFKHPEYAAKPSKPVLPTDEDDCPWLSPPRRLRLLKTLPKEDPCKGVGTALLAKTDIQVLFLCKDNVSVANYDLALGIAGISKRKEGDRKTPLGDYAIDKPRPSGQFGTFIPVGYPTREQAKKGFTGGDIGVHGPSRGFRCGGFLTVLTNWTQGCLAVSSDLYIKQIARFVTENRVERIRILPPDDGSLIPGPVSATPDPDSTPRRREENPVKTNP